MENHRYILGKNIAFIAIAAFAIMACFAFKQTWLPYSHSISAYTSFEQILKDPRNNTHVLGISNGFLLTNDGSFWKPIGELPKTQSAFKQAYSKNSKIYFLFENRLDTFDLETQQWNNLYKISSSNEQLLSFANHMHAPTYLFLGTSKQLLQSTDHGISWQKLPFQNGSSPIHLIKTSEKHLYFATSRKLYRKSFYNNVTESVFQTNNTHRFYSKEPSNESIGQDTSSLEKPAILDLAFGKGCNGVWLATINGVYLHDSCDNRWHSLSGAGLKFDSIHSLFHDPESGLFGTDQKQIYHYQENSNRWEELASGIHSNHIHDLFITKDAAANISFLLASTKEGLFRYPLQSFPEPLMHQEPIHFYQPPLELFEQLLMKEPSIHHIHQQVVKQANVSMKKTARWQQQSRWRALLPSFSVGGDISRSNNIDLDRGSTSTPDQYIFGPEDISRGRDWDLSWNLDDLIWSSSQTSIDSREKSLIDLRHDLLGEVTHFYYERRRLQLEIIMEPSSSQVKHLERLLRMDELTALIDALTNGYMGKTLAEIYEKHPELGRLWHYSGQKTRDQVPGPSLASRETT